MGPARVASISLTNAPVSVDRSAACLHCGSSLRHAPSESYCCAGCKAVATLLGRAGLSRYYELGGRDGAPVALSDPARRDLAWLEPIEESLARASGTTRVALDIQGMHCSGCVWVLGELFARHAGASQIVPDAALGRLELWVDASFPLGEFVREVESFGYLLGPPLKRPEPALDSLLVRTGVALALAANSMMFALALYVGLDEESGALRAAVQLLELVLSVLAVSVAAPVFVRGAWQGLRRGVLHLDVPIALGMLLALAGSVWAYFARDGVSYGDSVAVFAALMLVGRFIQRRALAHTRDRLLASEGGDGLYARRLADGQVHRVRASALREGDALLVPPGEVMAVDARLCDDTAEVSLDWIDGESASRVFYQHDVIPAGAFNVSSQALRAEAATDWAESPLPALLGRASRHDDEDAISGSPLWDRVARLYAGAVLLLASGALLGWFLVSGDLGLALQIAVAVLVVTCPCGLGIASPLAYRLAATRLRRAGLFLRRERALDRACEVREVILDKTGTVTTGSPEVEDPSVFERLGQVERAQLENLVARSAHPKSAAVRRALGDVIRVDDTTAVREVAGCGLEGQHGAQLYRLGAPAWAAPDEAPTGAELVFARDGRVLLAITTREAMRPDASREIARLEAMGHQVSLLSGDAPARVTAIASTLGLALERARGGASPQDKARVIESYPRALFVGDGINDGLAAERAYVSGTPAVDRPFLPARTDFFFVTPGIAPIRELLETATQLRTVVRRNLMFTLTYNVAAVLVALAGLAPPWVAAVAMPTSSLAVVGLTVWGMRQAAPSMRATQPTLELA